MGLGLTPFEGSVFLNGFGRSGSYPFLGSGSNPFLILILILQGSGSNPFLILILILQGSGSYPLFETTWIQNSDPTSLFEIL